MVAILRHEPDHRGMREHTRRGRKSAGERTKQLALSAPLDGGNADGKAHYGIVVLGGDENLIEIGKKGAVTSKSHLAIYGGDQHETIRNYGLVDGSVVLNEAGPDGELWEPILQA
jgi:hypothetical protein